MDRTHSVDMFSYFSVLFSLGTFPWAFLVGDKNADSQDPIEVPTGKTANPQEIMEVKAWVIEKSTIHFKRAEVRARILDNMRDGDTRP
jgi:hypothetical protein